MGGIVFYVFSYLINKAFHIRPEQQKKFIRCIKAYPGIVIIGGFVYIRNTFIYDIQVRPFITTQIVDISGFGILDEQVHNDKHFVVLSVYFI